MACYFMDNKGVNSIISDVHLMKDMYDNLEATWADSMELIDGFGQIRLFFQMCDE